MRFLLAAAVLIAHTQLAAAQWTEHCEGPGSTYHSDRICQCPSGTNKVRRPDRDLSDIRNTKGIRSYDCVQVAKPIERIMIFFDFGQEEPPPSSVPLLDAIIGVVKAQSVTKVEVVGHTDTALAAPLSKRLSEARAVAVKNALVAKGVPASAITTRGEGKSKPLVPTPDGTKEPQNRRVEVLLYK
jgi:outer membrane protein OmpA-like peptidoglycan-associated protein